MIIGKILWIKDFKPNLNIKMYLLCMVIALIIFLINSIFQMIFVKRLSIIELIKSSLITEIGKGIIVIGTTSLILLIMALYLFPKIIKQEIFRENNKVIPIIIVTIIIAPYFIIGSMICVTNEVVKKFRKVYNNNLLVLSSLKHKFRSYKSVLYLVLILASASMGFIGTAYSMYSITERDISEKYPYDISFIENTKTNNISKGDLSIAVKASGGEIKEHKALECLNLPDYRVYEEKVILYIQKAMILQNKNMNVEDFLDTLDKEKYIYVNKNKKRYINASYTNESQILEYHRSVSFIINDDDYKKIKDGLGEDALSYDHLIMLKDHKDHKSFNSISNK